MADYTTGRCTDHSVVAGDVSRYTADDRTLDTSFRQRPLRSREKGEAN
jgi:hypothetical protein